MDYSSREAGFDPRAENDRLIAEFNEGMTEEEKDELFDAIVYPYGKPTCEEK